MEIGENVDGQTNPAAAPAANNSSSSSSSSLHTTQSQPILLDCESNQSSEKDTSIRKTSNNRRVSFASSTQLTQYLEPINPFESFGKRARGEKNRYTRQ
jgi:hypothetical protein